VKVKAQASRRFPRRQSAHLLIELVVRDLKSRYVGSMAGPLWAVLAPLLWVLIYTFVFSVVLRIPLTGEPPGITFPEYLLAGFLPWIAIQEGISRSATCLSDNAAMVKKTVFPKQTLVATVVLTALVNELIGLALRGVPVVAGHLSLPWLALWFPSRRPGDGDVRIGCLSPARRSSARHGPGRRARARDAGIPHADLLIRCRSSPPRFRWVVDANPLAHLVEGFRDAFFRHTLPRSGSLVYSSSLRPRRSSDRPSSKGASRISPIF
jgi:ABC-type polysaccharide/polyol phosphate export permease